MKIRTDFVTNSSSSSFILAFKDKEDATNAIIQSLKYYPEALGYVLNDVSGATPLSEQQLQERLTEEAESYAYIQMSFGGDDWWSSSKPTWETQFNERHPGLTHKEMRQHPEYIAEKKRRMDIYIAAIKDRLQGKPYVIELEYSDNDGSMYSELEHHVMPHVPGVVAICDHH